MGSGYNLIVKILNLSKIEISNYENVNLSFKIIYLRNTCYLQITHPLSLQAPQHARMISSNSIYRTHA